jgi:transcriptional regulator with XRE-family HTH domain
MLFYERFIQICKEKGAAPTTIVLEALGHKGVISQWKKGSIPNGDTLARLAGRLSCTLDYLLMGIEGKSEEVASENSEIGAAEHRCFLCGRNVKGYREVNASERERNQPIQRLIQPVKNAPEDMDSPKFKPIEGLETLQHEYICDNCGKYWISDAFHDFAPNEARYKDKFYIFSGLAKYYYEQPVERGHHRAFIALDDIFIDNLLANPIIPRTVTDKVDRLLMYCYNQASSFGEFVDVSFPAISFAKHDTEHTRFIEYAVNRKYLEKSKTGEKYALTGLGYQRCEEIDEASPRSKTAFIAMWFDSSVDPKYEEAVREVIAACGFKPYRIDKEHFNGNIYSEILTAIKNCAFVIADLTGHRNGVYYESGYAHGLGREVIVTCEESDFKYTHFDLAQIVSIKWSAGKIGDFKRTLFARIVATIDKANPYPDAEQQYAEPPETTDEEPTIREMLKQMRESIATKDSIRELKDDISKMGELTAKITELKRENAALSERVAALEPKETPSADIASGTAT